MIPHSELYGEASRFGHSIQTQVSLYRGATLLEPDVKIVDGNVKSDRGSNTRWSSSITIGSHQWESLDIDTDGCWFSVRKGITTLGYTELLPLGVYRVADVKRGPRNSREVSGEGPEAYVIDDRFLTPRQPPYGQSTVQAMADLIGESMPGVTGVIASNTYDRPVQMRAAWERDRIKALNQLAETIKAEVYADSSGSWVIKDDPTLALPAYVYRINAGDGGVLMDFTGGQTRDQVYNAVAVTGRDATEDGQPPVFALVKDDNPSSSTYWDGPFGHKPLFYTNDGIDSVERAAEIGRARLQAVLTANTSFSFTSAAVCFLEAGDVVRVEEVDGVWRDYLINSTSLGLGTSATLDVETYVMRTGGVME